MHSRLSRLGYSQSKLWPSSCVGLVNIWPDFLIANTTCFETLALGYPPNVVMTFLMRSRFTSKHYSLTRCDYVLPQSIIRSPIHRQVSKLRWRGLWFHSFLRSRFLQSLASYSVLWRPSLESWTVFCLQRCSLSHSGSFPCGAFFLEFQPGGQWRRYWSHFRPII